MPTPVANFTYLIQNLTVDFTDLSSNAPTAWNWDFGDSNSSTVQNPQHVYADSGTYDVTLASSNADGDSDPTTIQIRVEVPTSLFINDFLDCDLPEGLTIEENCKNVLIKKWQLWLQTLIDPHINTPDVHNETAWPDLMNALIAKLVIRDAFLRSAQGAMVLLMQAGSGSEESSQEGGAIGQEKLIETGPTKVEWHQASDMIGQMMKNGAGENGSSIFDSLRQQCCSLASRMRVKLPFCDPLPQSPIIPCKATKEPTSSQDILRDYYKG